MSYAYKGDPLGSRSMRLECAKIHSADDEQGFWFRGWDEEDMEVEVTVDGITPAVLIASLREWGQLPDVSGVIDTLIAALLRQRGDTAHGFDLVSAALVRAHGWSQDQADTWLAEELQKRYASRG